jgi:Grx4 family monothiol glutaredoxin
MLFMKGSPDSPRCGFSKKIVEILRTNKIPFASFDILTDESVRAGLKVLYNWPTYPQLYVRGNLVGGLDIVSEMASDESSPLREQLELTDADMASAGGLETMEDKLRRLIDTAPVMLFMKGTPAEPRCGFSRSMVQLLRDESIEFSSFDILEDNEVREKLKVYSNWPTYPQLYVKGSLVGGLDIVREMKEEGPLREQLGL